MLAVLGLSLAMIVIGIVLGLLLIPWVGLPVAAIGLVLLVVYLVAAARRPAGR